MIRRSILGLSLTALVTACTLQAPVGTPQAGTSATPIAKASGKPSLSPSPSARPTSAIACTAPAPITRSDGRPALMAMVDGMGVSFETGALTVMLKMHPAELPEGSGGVTVTAVDVVYAISTGRRIRRTESLRVPVAPVRLPFSRSTAWGAAAPVTFSLPIHAIKGDLALFGTTVTAELSFVDEAGFAILGPEDDPNQPVRTNTLFEIPLSSSGAAGDEKWPDRLQCTVPTADLPVPIMAETEEKPHLVEWRSMTPPEGLRWTPEGKLSASTVKVALAALPTAAATTITGVEMRYRWGATAAKTLAWGETEAGATAPIAMALQAPVTVPAGSARAYGAPVEMTLSLDAAALKTALGAKLPPLATAEFIFLDAEGVAVQNMSFEHLIVKVPVLVE
jgi:hypothetical protein